MVKNRIALNSILPSLFQIEATMRTHGVIHQHQIWSFLTSRLVLVAKPEKFVPVPTWTVSVYQDLGTGMLVTRI